MADLPSKNVDEVLWQKDGQIAGGTRIVIVLDPTTLTGGTIILDKNVPAAKTFEGLIQISGSLK